MSILPKLSAEDNLLLECPVTDSTDEGTYVRCDHQGGGVSYWRYLETLAGFGTYKPGTWVVVVVHGPGIPREGYPIQDDSVPCLVRQLPAYAHQSNGPAAYIPSVGGDSTT
jgi:hypothetical protein